MKYPILALALVVGGCAWNAPSITELSEGQVTIKSGKYAMGVDAYAEARRGCATYGKRPVLLYQDCDYWRCAEKTYVYDCID